MIKRDPSRFLQIGFIGLLLLCVLQVGYWITENLLYTRVVQAEIEALAASEPRAVAALTEIEAASEGRSNRYLWEGSFFLVVLIAGISVLTRTLRHDSELRRRQQNFLAAVSHEFKSPLASMQLAAETLVLRAAEADAKKLGQRILEDCTRLQRMVDNLLDTARIEEGRQELAAEPLDVHGVVSAQIAAFAPRAAEHAIAINEHVPESLTLEIDRHAFEAMLQNLIDNALKACIAGGGRLIRIDAGERDGAIELSVTDDGLGFPPEDASLMFEKFHRLGDELRRQTPGTGLGLYIVKRLVELSGGRVGAQSAGPGQGARFTLSWSREGES